jgi:hypothetical protein
MARKRSACYLSIVPITFMSGSRTFLNFGAKTPPDRRPLRQARSAALHNGLRALGWEHGHNVRIEWRWASGDATRLPDYAAELVKLPPDLFVATGSPSLEVPARGGCVDSERFRDRQRSGCPRLRPRRPPRGPNHRTGRGSAADFAPRAAGALVRGARPSDERRQGRQRFRGLNIHV